MCINNKNDFFAVEIILLQLTVLKLCFKFLRWRELFPGNLIRDKTSVLNLCYLFIPPVWLIRLIIVMYKNKRKYKRSFPCSETNRAPSV